MVTKGKQVHWFLWLRERAINVSLREYFMSSFYSLIALLRTNVEQ